MRKEKAEEKVMSFWKDVVVDIWLIIRHPRQWWHDITYAKCRFCGREYKIGQQLTQHKIMQHGRLG